LNTNALGKTDYRRYARKTTKVSLIHERYCPVRISRLFHKPEAEALNQSDPTDHALAAIASILDQPEAHRGSEKPPIEATQGEPQRSAPDGYSKIGPGPMAAIRFKWTVRYEDNGEYYVDETIGENSARVITGPMSGDAAIKFVDDRESEARRRLEALRGEMAGRGAATTLVRKDRGEI
jgi:hypothetical protein